MQLLDGEAECDGERSERGCAVLLAGGSEKNLISTRDECKTSRHVPVLCDLQQLLASVQHGSQNGKRTCASLQDIETTNEINVTSTRGRDQTDNKLLRKCRSTRTQR